MMKKILLATIVALSAGIVPGFLPDARAEQTFSVQSASVSALGDEIGSIYDIFSISGRSGQWDAGGQQTIADLTFLVGGNCYACTLTPSGMLGFSLQVGSVVETANVGWMWSSTGPVDSLHITPPGDTTFIQTNGEVDVLSWTATPALLTGTGGPVYGKLNASIEVPEPASLALLGSGLIAVGGLLRRKSA